MTGSPDTLVCEMRICALFVLLAIPILAQTAEDHRAVVRQLSDEANLFDRLAHRIAGVETLRQIVPQGARIGLGRRGVETALPGFTREIVSEYGFISTDERGGPIREIRNVLTVDGLKWKRGTTSLQNLAREITARDHKSRKRQLEDFEDFGLSGFISDLGQLILLFARGAVSRYEIQFEKPDGSGLWVYTYQQLDGPEALTVYGEGSEPSQQKLRGRIWVQPGSKIPARISLDSEREVKDFRVRDTSVVEYSVSPFGLVLPERIVHQQFADQTLLVTDEFTYSGYREIAGGSRR